MAAKENIIRVTRAAAAKRRATTEETIANNEQERPSKKRAGEIHNINVERGSKRDVTEKKQTAPKKKNARKDLVEEKSNEVENVGVNDGLSGEDQDDPQLCAVYDSNMYLYLRRMEMESKRWPLPDYLEKVQKDVCGEMREILVDMLVEMAEDMKLRSDTIHLAVSCVDRFLSFNVIEGENLLLLGISSLLIASKYEEISPSHVEIFCYFAGNIHTKAEVLKMENDVLNFLKFEMGSPTIKTFLRIFTREDTKKNPDLPFEYMGDYLAELSLLDYACVKFLSSLVAAAIVFMSRFTLQPTLHPWSNERQRYTGYKAKDLKVIAKILHDLQLCKRGIILLAVREKYKQPMRLCLAT